MHVYLYDTFVNQKKFEPTVARIETRITDLGLNGKIVRRGTMNSVYSTIENEIRKGAKTIIAVGDSGILNQSVNAVARVASQNINASNVPLGFIPVGKKNNDIAWHLGLGLNEEACDILSARRIKTLDLGMANDYYFLTSATITTEGTTVEIDQNYSIEISEPGEVEIINLPINTSLPEEIRSSANDGVLELCISTNSSRKFLSLSGGQSTPSIFSFKKLRILNKSVELLLDQHQKIKSPIDIKISNEKINMIVGKNRSF